jgi:hypothetical protein
MYPQVIDSWIVPDKDQDIIQQRIRRLTGIPDWVDSSMRIFDLTGSQKAVTWLRLTMGPMAYLFHGIFQDRPHVNETLTRLIASLHKCAIMTYDVLDLSVERDRMVRFKEDVAESFALFEVTLDKLSPTFHFPIIYQSRHTEKRPTDGDARTTTSTITSWG